MTPPRGKSESDRALTVMQETGQTYFVGTLAEAIDLCDTLALDPRHVIVRGHLAVELAHRPQDCPVCEKRICRRAQ